MRWDAVVADACRYFFPGLRLGSLAVCGGCFLGSCCRCRHVRALCGLPGRSMYVFVCYTFLKSRFQILVLSSKSVSKFWFAYVRRSTTTCPARCWSRPSWTRSCRSSAPARTLKTSSGKAKNQSCSGVPIVSCFNDFYEKDFPSVQGALKVPFCLRMFARRMYVWSYRI